MAATIDVTLIQIAPPLTPDPPHPSNTAPGPIDTLMVPVAVYVWRLQVEAENVMTERRKNTDIPEGSTTSF
jgi:hypothetical protein